MRTHIISALSVLATLAVLAPAPAMAQERSNGIYAGVEALASSRFLLLQDGSRYEITGSVWKRYRSTITDLEKGESFDFFHKRGKLISIVSESSSSTGPDQRVRRTGKFVRQRVDGKRVWLVLENGREEVISPKLFRSRTKGRLINNLRKGQRIIFWTKGGYVVDLIRGSLTENKVDPDVAKILSDSQKGDRVHVQLKRENSPKFYRIKIIQAHRLFLHPHVPNTESPPRFRGTVVFNLKDIALVINRAARNRAANADNDPENGNSDTGSADRGGWDQIKVGDMIGIGFKRGQLTELTTSHYTWRTWTRGFWGEEEKVERGSVQKIREGIDLPLQLVVPLEGGRLEIRVNRSRSARRGGLKFKLELVHNVKPVILVNLKVRFLLGGMTMGPDDPVQSSETYTVKHPMFANQREAISQDISNSKFFDGRVEVNVYPKNVVPIKSKEARLYILKAIAGTTKPSALRSIYEAAGTNGDRKVCSLLLSRYLLERDPDHKRVLLKGLQAFGKMAPNLILNEIVGLDRHLEITRLVGTSLVQTPLPQGIRPVLYKRKQVDLLPNLRGALRGELGQKLFDIYNEREDLRDRIEDAFKTRPRDAVTSLLGIATQVDVTASDANEARLRAEGAAKLLRNLGRPVLSALYAELKKQEIDPGPCEDLFEKTGSASDAIKLGQNMLIQQYLRLQEEEWTRLIEQAEGLAGADKEWDRALAIVRGVLARKKDHEEARLLLPSLLVNKGIAQREEGNRGEAAIAFEEALPLLNVGERSKATIPMAEMLVQSASEDVEQVSLRTHPHPAAGLVRPAKLNETFEAVESWRRRWLEVKVGDGVAYLLKNCTRPAGEGKVAISSSVSPFKEINEMLDRAKEFSKAMEATANEVYGRLSAREGKAKYEDGQFQAALHHFDEAAKFAPTDPRLGLRFKCLLKANTGPLVAAGLVLAFAIGIGLMQAFSRPKKVAFKGDFKHYGAERSARERDLDLPSEED